ncbi:MAG: hypothetical protein IPM08_03300 [Actinomycetales bacterium]|nr:hypothetical protein [Actinomycetales bacterium]
MVTLSFHLTGPGGSRDGGWKVELTTPSLRIRCRSCAVPAPDTFCHRRADAAKPTVA